MGVLAIEWISDIYFPIKSIRMVTWGNLFTSLDKWKCLACDFTYDKDVLTMRLEQHSLSSKLGVLILYSQQSDELSLELRWSQAILQEWVDLLQLNVGCKKARCSHDMSFAWSNHADSWPNN